MKQFIKYIVPVVPAKFLLAAMLVATTMLPALAQSPAPEYRVKAAFIYHFTQFVDWPHRAFMHEPNFVIGILGDDPFGRSLEETVRGETVKGRQIVIKRLNRASDANPVHLLYISRSVTVDWREIRDRFSDRPVLTIGEYPEFTREGGIVRFFTVNKKIRFEINPRAARIASLNISSKLLSVAEIQNSQ